MKRQPCNSHAVVRELAHSTTNAYRSGAGSVYPLIKRLEQSSLLMREKRMYRLTDEGREALRNSILPRDEEIEVQTNLDHIRASVYFLSCLSDAEVSRYFRLMIDKLTTLKSKVAEDLESYRERGDRFSELAQLGVLYETNARIEWLNEIQRRHLEMVSAS